MFLKSQASYDMIFYVPDFQTYLSDDCSKDKSLNTSEVGLKRLAIEGCLWKVLDLEAMRKMSRMLL